MGYTLDIDERLDIRDYRAHRWDFQLKLVSSNASAAAVQLFRFLAKLTVEGWMTVCIKTTLVDQRVGGAVMEMRSNAQRRNPVTCS